MNGYAETNRRTAMMYFGEVPWHHLGTRLDAPATAEEAIVAAGLDYAVALAPLAADNDIPAPQRKAVVRTDTRQVLSVSTQNRPVVGGSKPAT